MKIKALFDSTGVVSALVEVPERKARGANAVADFGPVTRRGEKYETLPQTARMKEILAGADAGKLRVVKRAGAFLLSGSGTKTRLPTTKRVPAGGVKGKSKKTRA